jgi:hypothetical protein
MKKCRKHKAFTGFHDGQRRWPNSPKTKAIMNSVYLARCDGDEDEQRQARKINLVGLNRR